MIIKLKIDVTKIDKARLFKGAKGTYLDATLLENKDGVDQYGNSFMVVQDVSKEERLAGIKGAILGNGKVLDTANKEPKANTAPKPSTDNSDVPF